MLAQQEAILEKKKTKLVRWFSIVSLLALIAISYSFYELSKSEQKRKLDLFNSHITQASFQLQDDQFKAAHAALKQNDELLAETEESITSIPSSRQYAKASLQHYVSLFSQIKPINSFPQFESEIHSFIAVNEGFVLGGKGGQWGYLNPVDGRFKSYTKLEKDVKAIVFYPPNQWLITGDSGGQIILWDKEIRKVGEQTIEQEVTAFAISGDKLIAGDSKGNLHRWTITSQGLQQHNSVPEIQKEGRISTGGLTLNQDNTRLLIAAYEPTLKLWNVNNETDLLELKGETQKNYKAIFSQNEKAIATMRADNSIRLYDFSTNLLQSFFGHKEPVFSGQFFHGDSYFVSGSQDNQIRVWDVESGKTLQVLEGHEATVTNLLINDNKLWSAGLDGKVNQWLLDLPYKLVETCVDNQCPDSFDPTLIGKPIEYRKHPISVSISPQGHQVVFGFLDGSLRLYRLPDMTLLDEIKAHQNKVRSLSFNETGHSLVTASYDKTVKLWQVENDNLIEQQIFAVEAEVYDAALSENGKQLATASMDGSVKLYSVTDPKNTKTVLKKDNYSLFVKFFDEIHLLTTVGDQAYTTNIETNETQLLETAKENNLIFGIANSDKSGYKAIYGQEGKLVVYDSSGNKFFQTIAHDDTIYKAIFSPNGKLIATLGGDEKFKVWDLDAKNNHLLFTIDLPVNGNTLTPIDNLSPVYDFDFRCTPTGCWIVVPLTSGRIVVYHLGENNE